MIKKTLIFSTLIMLACEDKEEINPLVGTWNMTSADGGLYLKLTKTQMLYMGESEAKSMTFFGIINPISWFTGAGTGSKSSASTSSKSLTVIITFDDNKSVVDYAYQSLSF